MSHPSRRKVLQLLSASVTGGPLLLPGLARTAMAAGSGEPPRRFIAFTTPCGSPPQEFWPQGTPEAFTFGRILKPLEAFKSRVLVPDGLNIRKDGSKPGDDHQQGTGKLLTGANLLPGPYGGAGISPGWSSAPSLDQVIAAKLSTKSIYAGVQVTRANTWSRYSYIGRDKPNTPIGSPAELYRMLFGDGAMVTPGPGLAAARPVTGKASIDFLLADAGRLAMRLGTPERTKLDEQLEFLNERAKRLSTPEAPATTNGRCTPVAPMNIDVKDNANHEKVGRLHIDNIVAAMRCDVARVAVLQYSQSISDTNFSWVMPGETSVHHHSMTHRFNGTGGQRSDRLSGQANELFVRCSTWYAEQLRYLMEQLDRVPEGKGTMLDNTIIFWGSDTNGFSHVHQRMQFLIAGGGGGKVKGGRWVNYGGRNHNDLLTAIAHVMDVPMDKFGEESYCKEPVALG